MGITELLDILLQRSVCIVLALSGATIAIAGSLLLNSRPGRRRLWAQGLVRVGYAATAASIVIFIAAGFWHG
jgi:hypothetical protein